MKISMGRIFALLVVCVGATFVANVSVASAAEEGMCATPLTGSGSSLQNNLQANVWIPGFPTHQLKNDKCKNKIEIKYKSTSSGKGIGCFGGEKGEGGFELNNCNKGESLDGFIGTDVGPEEAQRANMKKTAGGGTKVFTIPVAQSAITVEVSMPIGCDPSVKNTTIRPRVNDRSLEKLWDNSSNKLSEQVLLTEGAKWEGAGCSTGAPTLFARSIASGTTAGFKRALAQISKSDFGSFTGNAKESESTTWPNTEIKKSNEKSPQQSLKTFETPNSETYVDLSNAREQLPPHGQLKIHKNAAGQEYYTFVVEVQNGTQEEAPIYQPPESESSEASACKEVSYGNVPAKNGPGSEWSKTVEENPFGKTEKHVEQYPICTLTFDVAWESYEALGGNYPLDKETGNAVQNYLQYIVNEGQNDSEIQKDHFGSLPEVKPSVVGLAKEGATGIKP